MTIYTEITMGVPQDLFTSPELCPLQIDVGTESLMLARFSRQAYRDCISLGMNGARLYASAIYQMRVDDVLLAASGAPPISKPTHYILHAAYCCSTLLARYLELIPSCFVLKEPQLLAQLALAYKPSLPRWNELFDLGVRLLSRTYEPEEVAIIKMHVPCNVLGERLLQHNPRSTITFLATPLRHFVLAVLKSNVRRRRVRYWLRHMAQYAQPGIDLVNINPADLTDAEVAVCFWILNRAFCEQLSTGPYRSRVLVLDGECVAEFPREVLPNVTNLLGLSIGQDQLRWLVEHPSFQRHAKQPSRPYDAASRRREIGVLENRWGVEVGASIAWAASHGMLSGLSMT
jgi:hypothetical protein